MAHLDRSVDGQRVTSGEQCAWMRHRHPHDLAPLPERLDRKLQHHPLVVSRATGEVALARRPPTHAAGVPDRLRSTAAQVNSIAVVDRPLICSVPKFVDWRRSRAEPERNGPCIDRNLGV